MLITTATGKTYDALLFSNLPRLSWAEIRLKDIPIAEIAQVFADPEETKLITGGGITIEGYALSAIRVERGYTRIDLMKGATE